jgi:hypothetical protein
MGKAELLKGTANRHLVEIDIKAFLDEAPEVDAWPARHAVLGGSGPVSTMRFNSCFCSADSLGTGPGALPLMSPSGPIASISAAALRLIPSSTAASDSSRRALDPHPPLASPVASAPLN